MLAVIVLHPEHIGPYQLVRPLGVGGMAETFLALRRGPAGFEQRVCVKRILPAFTGEPKFVELFLDEARLLAHMHSAGIVQVFDFGEADGSFYMALELVEGTDLETLLRACARSNTRLPVSVALYIAGQLLSALDYAHTLAVDGQALHIVHRDISPSNVLLSQHGEVKLTDFGIARSRQRRHKTGPGQTKGKLAYMCPEQVRGDALDARSDLYSVGVVLYEMLAGAHPHAGGSELELINRILGGQRPNLRALVPEISLETKQMVDRMLTVAPSGRPASAREALKLLPLKEQPFVVQRRLSELVSSHCAERAAPPACRPRGTVGPAAPTTEPLRARDDARFEPAATTLAGKRRQVAARAPKPVRRAGGRLLRSVASMLLASTLVAWPLLHGAPGESAPAPRPASAATLAVVRVAAAAPQEPQSHAQGTRAEAGPPARAAETGLSAAVAPTPSDPDPPVRRARARRAPAPPGAPDLPPHLQSEAAEPPRHKGRSGLSVRADEF